MMNEEEVNKLFADLDKNEIKLRSLIPDHTHRGEMACKMESIKPFEYFGDKFLTMEDFWTQLSDENRLILLGHTMSMSVVHHYYGKYKPIFEAMADIIEMHKAMSEEMKKSEATGLPIQAHQKPSYLG